MEEIIELLEGGPSEIKKALAQLTASEKDPTIIENLRAEYLDGDRTIRKTQIGHLQKDKKVKGKGIVPAVRIPIPFQNKIVATATAFEVGEPVTLVPEIFGEDTNRNALSDEIHRLFRSNRLDSKFQKAIMLQKSELQCAILFYTQPVKKGDLYTQPIGEDRAKDIKSKILENKNGRMAPHFDGFGDMQAFTWQFDTIENGKTVMNTWVYTDTLVYKFSNRSGTFGLDSKDPHDFSKIPVVYFSQERPEWYLAQHMIDRIEVAMSRLGASNDYSGHPILKLYGDVQGAPDKDEDGKALRFNMVEDEANPGKFSHGDAEFLTHEGAPEAVKEELDRLEKYIYSLTSTPDISFDNLKSLGDISGIAIKLMFLDAIMKSKLNEGANRTAMERIISVLVSGIVTTTVTKLRGEAAKTFFSIQFNSILPDDLQSSVETYARAVEAGIISVETAVADLDMTGDAKQELADIRAGQERKAKLKASAVPQDPLDPQAPVVDDSN